MRIVSWNVNGLRACTKKGFLKFLNTCQADVLALQEVRAYPEQLELNVRKPDGWFTYFCSAERPGYAGVAIYTRQEPTKVSNELGVPKFDTEGRFIIAHFEKLAIASVYFPKGSGKERDNSRVGYKLEFYREVFDYVQKVCTSMPIYVVGDYNTAHMEIDLARPKTNQKSSGFLPEERAEISRWLDAGWIDTFRTRHRDETGHYTWWRQWGDARKNNVGWRIDYVLASPSADRKIADAFIWPDTEGSDHCPVGVDIK